MRRIAAGIDACNAVIGRSISLLIFVMIGVIMYETIARYFFNAPTPWAHDISGWLQVGYVFLGGAFALQRGFLVRVDIIYAHLSLRAQALIDLTVSTVLFGFFSCVIIWKSSEFAYLAFQMGEVSSTGVWSGPVYPAKFMIPIGMVLLTASWLARCMRQILRLIDPTSIEPEVGAQVAG